MQAQQEKVSVIMNCFNSSAFLKESIESALSQTYKNFEIIFFDDASIDDSLKIAQKYGDRIKCFKSEKKISLGRARNLAIEKSSGNYIAFLDCDDIWLPEKLEKQVAVFEKDNKIGLVFSDVRYFNEKGDIFSAYEAKKPPTGAVFRQLLQKNFLCVSSVMVKKEALLSLKEWFDKRFTGIEDWDLFLRISRDWKIEFVDEVLARYRMHQKSWTSLNQPAFPKELDLMIKKLKNLCPNFRKDYSKELKILRLRIIAQKFIIFLSKIFPKPFLNIVLKLLKVKNYSA